MKNVKTACLIAALTGLYGCGGGGGGGGSTSMNLETAQGIWDSSSYSGTDLGASTKAIRSVMLKDGNAWVFLLDNLITNNPTPIGLVKASVAVSGQSFSGTGKRYMLDTHTGSSVEVQGNVPATQQLALKFGAAANPTTLATLTPLNRASTAATITGAWTFSSTTATGVGTTTATVTWNIDGAGTLSGGDTQGCTFQGQVLPRSEPAGVFNVTLTQTCAGTVSQYSGVALQNSASTSITFGLVATDQSTGTVVVANKVTPT
ncbi:MAG: hypothetical protein KA945_04125 [Zoogloea sp.]|jgi:hypothetical protein|nr:hypothetical protein [Zoogloea sp.]